MDCSNAVHFFICISHFMEVDAGFLFLLINFVNQMLSNGVN